MDIYNSYRWSYVITRDKYFTLIDALIIFAANRQLGMKYPTCVPFALGKMYYIAVLRMDAVRMCGRDIPRFKVAPLPTKLNAIRLKFSVITSASLTS